MPKQSQQSEADRGESIVSMSTTKTAVGEIDTLTVAPKGDVEVDTGEEGNEGGVVVTDKVAARQDAEGDGGEGEGGEENRNLSDDVGQKQKPAKKPFRKTRDGRINELTGRLRETERTADDYRTELEEERAKSARLEQEKKRSDHAAVSHWRDKLKADLASFTRELKDAKDRADTDKEAEIQAKMTETQVNLGQANGWLESNKLDGAAPTTEGEGAEPKPKTETRQAAQPQKVEYKGEAKRWVSENPWFEEGTADYDPVMAGEARDFATYLENRLVRVGNKAAIGSADYFELIDQHIRQAFPDRFGDEEGDGGQQDRQAENGNGQQPARRGSQVAPVRGASTTVQRTEPASTNPNRIVLSQEQREVAHALILKHPDGRPFTPKEKEIAYARGMRKGA